jgi:hypothetical protein
MRTRHAVLDRVAVSVRWLARLTSALFAVGCLALLLYGLSGNFTGAPSSADPWTLLVSWSKTWFVLSGAIGRSLLGG